MKSAGPRVRCTAPCYDGLKDLGAVFGQKFGWERANWFAPEGTPQEDRWSFRRSNWFEHVGNEVRLQLACRPAGHVGFCQMPDFRPGAEAFLDNTANKLPKGIGRYIARVPADRTWRCAF